MRWHKNWTHGGTEQQKQRQRDGWSAFTEHRICKNCESWYVASSAGCATDVNVGIMPTEPRTAL